ncbi:hypothetical protein B0H17DRAFT_1142496 [Mycena rosella]|uniref:Uncharacterized protein n=1 Tax=Mycena rosella TaxID=1033263 RepID=A0AAD7CXK8_MYCRO|nr:hypothetical protein B0H17DRAFT_1142496 [Mycena rosella]
MITVHWILVIYQAFFAFIHLGNASAEVAFYEDYAQGPEAVKETLLFSVALLGDALVAYRLWIIWGRNRFVIIFPIFALVGMVAISVAMVIQLVKSESELVDTLLTGLAPLKLMASYSPLCCIIFHICRVTRVKSGSGSRLKFNKWFLVILIESAAIQTFWQIFALATYGEVDARDTFPAIVGISNTLIHARVGLGWSPDLPAAKQQSTQKHGDNIAVIAKRKHQQDRGVPRGALRLSTQRVKLIFKAEQPATPGLMIG